MSSCRYEGWELVRTLSVTDRSQCHSVDRNSLQIYEVFKMYRGYSSVALNKLFVIDKNNKGTRAHSSKLKKVSCTRDIVRYFLE